MTAKSKITASAATRGPVVTVDPELPTRQIHIERRMMKEVNATGFASTDPEVMFFTHVAALLRPDDFVLDFGAGRGEFMFNDPVLYRRNLQNFRGRAAHVDGCDVDPVVLTNPTLDAATVLKPGEPLPYADNRFDLVISRYVFEHVPDPEWLARELLRVTKPGGWICALTPNKYGYVALAAGLIPNSLHRAALKKIQPGRKEEDVFPTVYRMNTPGAARKYFSSGADIYYYRDSGTPAYHFGSRIMFRIQQVLHRILIPQLALGLRLFIQKHRE